MKSSGFKKKYAALKTKKGFRITKSALSSVKSLVAKRKTWKPKITPQKQLDAIVSKVIRIAASNHNGMVQCVTCGLWFHWMIIQCGHFIKRAHVATRYDPMNLGPQCEDCNCFKNGEDKKFLEYIDRIYGSGTAEGLKVKARQVVTHYPYLQEIEKWNDVLLKVAEERGVTL